MAKCNQLTSLPFKGLKTCLENADFPSCAKKAQVSDTFAKDTREQ